jgi:hypothetical protein
MISAVISSMNRTDRLIQMLPTWAEIEKISDIVIVDWSSKDPIIENENIKNILNKYNKIKIIRVENQKYFHLSKSYNIGFKYTNPKYQILLKLDVDYVSIKDSWIDCLSLNFWTNGNIYLLKHYFITGSWKFYRSSNGFLLVNKTDFKSINGYNENLGYIWGYEDVDLHKRLMQSKQKKDEHFSRIEFFNIKDYMYHIPHDDELRTCNYLSKEKDHKINQEISEKQPNWIPQEYQLLSEEDKYIRISAI